MSANSNCPHCGLAVSSGRYCPACTQNLIDSTRGQGSAEAAFGSKPIHKFFSIIGLFGLGFLITMMLRSGSSSQLAQEKQMEILRELGAPSNTKIVAFVADYCGACRYAEKRMNELGIPYYRADLQKDPRANEAFARLPGFSRAIPTFVAGGQIMVGYNEQRLQNLYRQSY